MADTNSQNWRSGYRKGRAVGAAAQNAKLVTLLETTLATMSREAQFVAAAGFELALSAIRSASPCPTKEEQT